MHILLELHSKLPHLHVYTSDRVNTYSYTAVYYSVGIRLTELINEKILKGHIGIVEKANIISNTHGLNILLKRCHAA